MEGSGHSLLRGVDGLRKALFRVIEVAARLLEPFERSERGEVWRGVARRGWGGLTDLVNRGLQIAPQIVQKSIPFSASSLGGVFGEKGWPKGAKRALFSCFLGFRFWMW